MPPGPDGKDHPLKETWKRSYHKKGTNQEIRKFEISRPSTNADSGAMPDVKLEDADDEEMKTFDVKVKHEEEKKAPAPRGKKKSKKVPSK